MKKSLKQNQKEFEAYANKKLKTLQKKLLLEGHNLKPIKFVPCLEEVANYTLDYPYKDILIKYGPHLADAWLHKDKQNVDRTLTHEMCHVITDGLMRKAMDRFASEQEIRDQLEQANEHITTLVMKYVH